MEGGDCGALEVCGVCGVAGVPSLAATLLKRFWAPSGVGRSLLMRGMTIDSESRASDEGLLALLRLRFWT